MGQSLETKHSDKYFQTILVLAKKIPHQIMSDLE
jgi:hypothetical protein